MQIIMAGFLWGILSTSFIVSSTEITTQLKSRDTLSKKNSYIMINFTEKENVNRWRITNDGVMGGRSSGRFFIEQGQAYFLGNISLDNNGGFSSVFREIDPLPEDLETVTIDIQGDGLTYQLRMIVSFKGYRLAYKHQVNTVVGKIEKLTFTLADFQASFRGRIIANAPVLKSEDIREVGFLVTRKVAGEFSLSIFNINF
jgi:hypothetical protein